MATNLVPWVITVHMFLALLVVCLQLMMIRRISPASQKTLNLPVAMKWLIGIILIITAYQMFLGTQVREYIDELTMKGLGRESWTSQFGWTFFIHRSFSWAVLVLMVLLVFLNYKTDKVKSVYWAFGILVLELLGGVLLAYADMPGFVQVSHLLCAIILFGILFMQFIRLKPLSKGLSKTSIRG
ncbi:Heme A synthase [compost metagenome]